MTMRRGRCNNIGLCENATRQRTIEVPDGQPFVCPKCEADLVSVDDRKSTRTATGVALPMVAIGLAVIGVAFGIWDLYGRPAAAPATQAMAPAQPQAMAAATPAPAPVPDAAAPAPDAVASAAAPGPAGAALPQAASAPTPDTAAPVPAAPLQATASASPAGVAPQAATPPQVGAAVPALVTPAPSLPTAPPAITAPAITAPDAAPVAPDAAPVAPAPAPPPAPDAAGSDPAQRVRAFLGNAARVPITITFRSGVVALTGHGEHELDRLVGYLKQHHAVGDRVYLAGFTDNQGDPASNEAVSQKRVAAVAAALTEASITPTHVASFGPALPVADNATQAGRDRNRRVEVYLAP